MISDPSDGNCRYLLYVSDYKKDCSFYGSVLVLNMSEHLKLKVSCSEDSTCPERKYGIEFTYVST